MAAIADFLSDIVDGLSWAAFALALGGLAWTVIVLRVQDSDSPFSGAPVHRAIDLIGKGALVLAIAQVLELAADAYILDATMGRSPFPALYGAAFFRAGSARALLAFAMAAAAAWLGAAPHDKRRWWSVSAFGLAIVVAGAWHSHGQSRIHDRELLMALTTLHSLAGAIWVGGVLHLLGLRSLAKRDDRIRPLWPVAIRRFSLLGMGAVGTAIATAIVLALYYVRSFAGLFGTGYGSMVLVKIALFLTALCFAGLNYRAGRQSGTGRDGDAVWRVVPFYVEAETFVLIALLMAAAALAHQPPALDLTNTDASIAEVLHVFVPKAPRITSPTHAEMPTDPNNLLGLSRQDRNLESAWSEYNHNVTGLVLVTMAVIAFLSRLKGFGWARHWPLGFVLLAIFLFIRSDPETWPLGDVPFLKSLADAEVFQHRVAILLAAVLGLIEWRARTTRRKDAWQAYVFPVLSAFGGLLLLTHSHGAFEIKPQYLIQVSHTVMGLFAMFLAIGRWLELKLEPPASRWAGLGATASLLLIGFILTFYQELGTV
ncbi:MAG TPA: CopD family protein [Alphaproteobacteria bacterium]|nr:CopD family protein [Alphaproteobacteria bacterium]